MQLHTIQQWYGIDQQLRGVLLKALRVRDRLWAHRLVREQHKMSDKTEGWVPCGRCEQKGWVYKKPRKAGIHPSALYSSCLLKIYYEAIGVQAQLVHEARDLFIFDIGTAVHDMLQRFGKEGAWGEYYKAEVAIGETELAKSLMIEGHADADNIIVIDDIPGAPIFEVGVVHEYKTINNAGFDGLKGKPKPGHVQQATIYSACLDRPVVVYLYFNKDNSNLQDFPIAYQPEVWEKMSQKVLAVKNAIETGTPPPGSVGYDCSQCAYVYQCPVYAAAKGKKVAT